LAAFHLELLQAILFIAVQLPAPVFLATEFCMNQNLTIKLGHVTFRVLTGGGGKAGFFLKKGKEIIFLVFLITFNFL